ncbi:MAG: RDD family protein [Acidimicrobiia bacterium]|nr:RDD family protein [Acidimicrobiia bacterium]
MSQPISAPGPLASWGDRVVATLIDAAVVLGLYVIVFVVSAIVGIASDALQAIILILGYLALSAFGLYLGFIEGETGQSPGKALTGLKVVRATDGQVIGGGMGIVRRLAHILDSFCLIGYLFPLFDPMRQTFADKIMTTVVLRDQTKQKLGPDLLIPPSARKAAPPTSPPPSEPPAS